MNVISTTDATYRPRDEAASLAATEGESTATGPAVADGNATGASPPAAQPSRLPLLLAIAAALIAAFAATVSAVGLAAASRTIAEARLAIQELRSPEAATPAAAPAAQADPHAPAATAADVREIVGTLRADIARYLAARDRAEAGAAPAAAALRDGQVEIANRLGAIEIRLGRLEKGPLSASR